MVLVMTPDGFSDGLDVGVCNVTFEGFLDGFCNRSEVACSAMVFMTLVVGLMKVFLMALGRISTLDQKLDSS